MTRAKVEQHRPNVAVLVEVQPLGLVGHVETLSSRVPLASPQDESQVCRSAECNASKRRNARAGLPLAFTPRMPGVRVPQGPLVNYWEARPLTVLRFGTRVSPASPHAASRRAIAAASASVPSQ